MSIRTFSGISPAIAAGAYVDESAVVIGDVVIGADSSVWPTAVLRGDVNFIRVGARTSIQDGSVLHVTHDHPDVPGGHPCVLGDDITVGHRVILHGCTIGDRCLIGMGAVVLDGARLEPEVLLGAGSLVPQGKVLEGGWLWMGAPAQRVRPLSDAEKQKLRYSAEHYVRLIRRYAAGG